MEIQQQAGQLGRLAYVVRAPITSLRRIMTSHGRITTNPIGAAAAGIEVVVGNPPLRRRGLSLNHGKTPVIMATNLGNLEMGPNGVRPRQQEGIVGGRRESRVMVSTKVSNSSRL